MNRRLFNRPGFGLVAGCGALSAGTAHAAETAKTDQRRTVWMGLHQTPTQRVAIAAALVAAVAAPARAEQPASAASWHVEPVEAPLGDSRACAATKMTGDTRGVGFTLTASGLETLTVAVQGWDYPFGKALGETVAVDGALPKTLDAFGQGNATLAKFAALPDKALRAGRELVVTVGDSRQRFDIVGLDEALTTLAACVKDKA